MDDNGFAWFGLVLAIATVYGVLLQPLAGF